MNKNSQILLIENVLSNLDGQLNEKDHLIEQLENEVGGLKNTISTLKFECKSSFDEQEKLEETITELRQQNHLFSEQLKTKEQQLNTKTKELESVKLQNEKFMDNVERRTDELKKQLEDKNSIIEELENINKELNTKLQQTTSHEKKALNKLQRKIEQDQFKSFVNSNDTYDFNASRYDKLQAKLNNTKPINPKLDKIQNKLNNTKKESKVKLNSHVQTEEDVLKRNLGF